MERKNGGRLEVKTPGSLFRVQHAGENHEALYQKIRQARRLDQLAGLCEDPRVVTALSEALVEKTQAEKGKGLTIPEKDQDYLRAKTHLEWLGDQLQRLHKHVDYVSHIKALAQEQNQRAELLARDDLKKAAKESAKESVERSTKILPAFQKFVREHADRYTRRLGAGFLDLTVYAYDKTRQRLHPVRGLTALSNDPAIQPGKIKAFSIAEPAIAAQVMRDALSSRDQQVDQHQYLHVDENLLRMRPDWALEIPVKARQMHKTALVTDLHNRPRYLVIGQFGGPDVRNQAHVHHFGVGLSVLHEIIGQATRIVCESIPLDAQKALG